MASNQISSSIAFQAHQVQPRESAALKWTLKKKVRPPLPKKVRFATSVQPFFGEVAKPEKQKAALSTPRIFQPQNFQTLRMIEEVNHPQQNTLKKVKIKIRIGDEKEKLTEHITQDELDLIRDLEGECLQRYWKPWAVEPNPNKLRFPPEFRRKARRGKGGKSKLDSNIEVPWSTSESPLDC